MVIGAVSAVLSFCLPSPPKTEDYRHGTAHLVNTCIGPLFSSGGEVKGNLESSFCAPGFPRASGHRASSTSSPVTRQLPGLLLPHVQKGGQQNTTQLTIRKEASW